jgi:hypothetical protein
MKSTFDIEIRQPNTRSEEFKTMVDCHRGWLNDILTEVKPFARSSAFPFKLNAAFWKALEIRLDYSHYRTNSRGGCFNKKPSISIAPQLHPIDAKNVTFKEYASFADSPSIGSFTSNAEWNFKALVLHELAHAIQYWARSHKEYLADTRINKAGLTFNGLKPPHGQCFQEIYRTLRLTFINHHTNSS